MNPIFIVTFSKHFGIQKQAFSTFDAAWQFAADALVGGEGEVFHGSAAECFAAQWSVVPSCTNNWKVGQLQGDAHVGPTVIYQVEM